MFFTIEKIKALPHTYLLESLIIYRKVICKIYLGSQGSVICSSYSMEVKLKVLWSILPWTELLLKLVRHFEDVGQEKL